MSDFLICLLPLAFVLIGSAGLARGKVLIGRHATAFFPRGVTREVAMTANLLLVLTGLSFLGFHAWEVYNRSR